MKTYKHVMGIILFERFLINRIQFMGNPSTTQNEETIKFFISTTDEPIPDITHAVEDGTSIFTHFRFFFNDPDLAILRNHMSVMHIPQFEHQIDALYSQWASAKQSPPLSQQTLNNQQSVNQPKGDGQHRNFIAFVEYWIRSSPKLKVTYQPYDELVKACVGQTIDNEIRVMQSQAHKKQFENKIKDEMSKEQRKARVFSKKAVQKIPDKQMAIKRLNEYFQFFAKGSPATLKLATFDQIKVECSTINLKGWIQFMRRVAIPADLSTLPKGTKTVSQLKNIFQKNCNNSKIMNFQQFTTAVHTFYRSLFSNKTPDQAVREGESILKLHSQDEFKGKLRELGAFVSDEVTIIRKPDLTPKPKPVLSRYLQKQNGGAQNTVLPKHKQELKKHGKLPQVKVNSTPRPAKNKIDDHSVSLASLKLGSKAVSSLPLGLDEEEEPDEYLDEYYGKMWGIVKRLDERIRKAESGRRVR